ncbi:hypothetical protein QC764_602057 [Podospora pseudoanserina]|uniref:SGNH hydrolase-type esterase domain-containing protein n=1 Tax=Podospora pseudoanserina TaxID=2609844 RepID=A0ABR0HTZ4_9PEZI|nr:hypothetical protein QC764_602057 [Podospora pseudoanserina]
MKFNGASRRSHRHFVAIATLIFSTLVLSTPGPVSNGQDGEQRVISDGAKDDTQTSREKSSDKEGTISGFNPPDFELRILALGDSITYGQGSSHGNGYRKYLRDSLRQAGYKVNMVGSKQHGLMNNNQVEARDKMDRVATIHGLSKHSVKYQPNVILIHAGTFDTLMQNDLYETEYNYSMPAFGSGSSPWIGGIYQRYADMVDYLFDQVPNTTIILSTIIPTGNRIIYKNMDYVTSMAREVVANRLWVLEPERPQKIVLADMWAVGIGAAEFEVMGRHDFRADGIHPNDSGYEKMASIFLRAIIGAGESGFLSPLRDSEHVENMAETYGDDLDTFTVEAQVPSPAIDENVMIYMAARATNMRGTGGKTPDDGIWSKTED